MFSAGDQVPVMPFVDVVGNAANVCPLQIGATALNVGTTFGLITMVIDALEAHCSGLGVKVYVVVVVLLMVAGDQVPVLLFKEVVGKAGTV